MLLKINEQYKGVHEVRILTADVKEEYFPVYKMSFWMPRPLRFFEFIFRGVAFYKGVKRVQREFDFDVVLFGNAMYGLISKLMMPERLIGGMINDYFMLIIKANNFLKHEGGKSFMLLKRVERFASKKLDFLISCSFFLKKYIVKEYKVKPKKIDVLYQAIDTKKICFKSEPISDRNQIKILFVKHLFKIGGLETLANALKSSSDYQFKLTVVGPYMEQEGFIRRLFSGVNNVQILFLGPQSCQSVHKLMHENHILCIPSLLEAQGLANIEGLASGIPVVTSNAGGIPEIMNNGTNGWMCEAGNAASLAAVLKLCIEAEDETKKAIAEKARKFVEANFDFPVCIKNLLNILEKRILGFKKTNSINPGQ